jgi:hypothetical protein
LAVYLLLLHRPYRWCKIELKWPLKFDDHLVEVEQENVTGTSHVVGSEEMGDDPAFKAILMKGCGQPWD